MNEAALLNMIISVLLSIAGALMAWAANKLHSIDKAVAVHEERLETHAEDIRTLQNRPACPHLPH